MTTVGGSGSAGGTAVPGSTGPKPVVSRRVPELSRARLAGLMVLTAAAVAASAGRAAASSSVILRNISHLDYAHVAGLSELSLTHGHGDGGVVVVRPDRSLMIAPPPASSLSESRCTDAETVDLGSRLQRLLSDAVQLNAINDPADLSSAPGDAPTAPTAAPTARPRRRPQPGHREASASPKPVSAKRLIAERNDMLAWRQRRDYAGTRWEIEATTALVELHRGIYHKLAWQAAQRVARLDDFADFFQTAAVGGLLAYNQYDPGRITAGKSGPTKLSTYVHYSVLRHLCDDSDSTGLVRCPRQIRADRAYARGDYDSRPEKRAAYEAQHSREQREQIRKDIAPLLSGIRSLDAPVSVGSEATDDTVLDCTPSTSALTEDQVVTHLEIERRRDGLTRVQQQIQTLSSEGFTYVEVAERIGLTVNQVRVQLRRIREHITQCQEIDAWEALSGMAVA